MGGLELFQVQIHVTAVEEVDRVITVPRDCLGEVIIRLGHDVVILFAGAREVVEAEAQVVVVEGHI